MRTVVLVSRCLRVAGDHYEMHFKGCLEGEVIKLVRLKTLKKLRGGDDYIVWLGVDRIEQGVLWGKAYKIRNLLDLRVDL